MISLALCFFAFAASYIASRRSLASGLAVVLTIGYFYGIVRANIFSPISQFIFDAAALGLYIPQFRQRLSREEKSDVEQIRPWLAALIAWPVVLLALPLQEPEILLVGLRASVYFLPFLWLGARLDRHDVFQLALTVAALNLVALAFAGAEFVLGVERFYPRNALTEIIYNSRDVFDAAGMRMFRIPATFSSAPAYAGTMVMSLPLLFGAWVLRDSLRWQRNLVMLGLVASILGVFLAASRTHALVLFLVLTVVTLSGKLRPVYKLAWMGMVAGLAYLVATNERLQRFTLLLDTDLVSKRVSGSVNNGFFDLLVDYPLGNGLGGGGTNIPGFFGHLVRNHTWMENEYARMVLEQGIPGLVLWIAFLCWLFSRRTTDRRDPWQLGRRLFWYTSLAYFGTGMIGMGLLTSVPQTSLMLLGMGWIAVRSSRVSAPRSWPEQPVLLSVAYPSGKHA